MEVELFSRAQLLDGQRVDVHDAGAAGRFGVGWQRAGIFRCFDGCEIRGAGTGGGDLVLAVFVQVVELAQGGVHPWHAARLRPALDIAQMENVGGGHALVFVGGAGMHAQIARVQTADPVELGAAVDIDLDAHAEVVADRQAGTGVDQLGGQALRLDQLKRERHAAIAERAVVLAHQDLAGLEHLTHGGALQITEVQLTAGVAGSGLAPQRPRSLDSIVDAIGTSSAHGLNLRLHSNAGADDVVDDDQLRALGVAAVSDHLARAGAQRRQAACQFAVGTGIAAAAESTGGAGVAGAAVAANRHARL